MKKLNKHSFLLILILFLAVILRLTPDIFISGYNFDEMAIVSIAKSPLKNILLNIANEDYHAPLYYLVVHIFTYFNNEWFLIRLLNVLFSVVNVFIFYKIGKLLRNKNTGLLCSLILAINHFHISVCSFVKYYCFDFLIFSCLIYYFLKFIKRDKNKSLLILFNNLACLSFTFGIIYVFIQNIVLYFIKKDVNYKKYFILSSIGFLIYLPILLIQTKNAYLSINSPQGAHIGFSFFALYSIFNDYFTPLISESINVPTASYIEILLNIVENYRQLHSFDWLSSIGLIFLSFIPVIISIILNLKALKNKYILKLNLTSGLFFIFLTILSLCDIIGFCPIYFFVFGIVIILNITFGVNYFKNKYLKIVLILFLIIPQLIISNYYPIEKREFGEKMYGLNKAYIESVNPNIPIILIDGARFSKYYYSENNIFSFDNEEISASHNSKWFKLLFGKEFSKNITKKNAPELLKDRIIENDFSSEFDDYIKENLISKLNKGDILILGYYATGENYLLDDLEIRNKLLTKKYNYHHLKSSFKSYLEENNTEFNQHEFGEIIFSKSLKELNKLLKTNFKILKVEQLVKDKDGFYSKVGESNKIKDIEELFDSNIIDWVFVTYQKQ